MVTLQELMQAGAHIGHKKSKWNPKMAPFVFGMRNNMHVIDVTKTLEKLNQAIEFLRETVRSGGMVLWVGARIQSHDMIEKTAQELGAPYVVGRWIGGLFTNFKIIKERLKYFRDLEEKLAGGGLEKYTKKERLSFERKLEKMKKEVGGIKNLQGLPQVIFVSDVDAERAAVLEAKKMGIKVVAIVDTSSDPSLVDYPIPANNDSMTALNLIINAIKVEVSKVTPRS